MTTRHELLTMLHEWRKPGQYLEIGVQYGHSLNLAKYSERAIGIDPLPLCLPHDNQEIFSVTSDDYFQYFIHYEAWVDLGFIDGSHLFEDALRDFINIQKHSHEGTIVVLDDVLPTTQEMTSRVMVPGHWTGDVWKLHRILSIYQPQLKILLVDTEPTGTMVVYNFGVDSQELSLAYGSIVDEFTDDDLVPAYILDRVTARSAEEVLQIMKMDLE